MPEQELEVRIVFQEDEQNPREVPLLALQTVGVAGKVSNTIEIKPRQNALALAAVLQVSRPEPSALESLNRTEFFQHIQGRGMKRRCPGFRAEIVTALKHGHRNAASKQSRRRRHPDRDLEKLCDVAGMHYVRVDRADGLEEGLSNALDVTGPCILEVDMKAIGDFPQYFKAPPYAEEDGK